jgi:hypothetical protein
LQNLKDKDIPDFIDGCYLMLKQGGVLFSKDNTTNRREIDNITQTISRAPGDIYSQF